MPIIGRPVRITDFYDSVGARFRGMPGVERVTFGHLPLIGFGAGTPEVTVGGRTRRLPQLMWILMGGPEYARTVGPALQSGRDIDPRDVEGSEAVAIVNESLARHLWPGRSALGQRFTFLPVQGNVQVVGVVRDGKYRGLREAGEFAIYLPLAQHRGLADRSGAIIGRAVRDAGPLVPLLAQQVRAFDPDLPIMWGSTLVAEVSVSRRQSRDEKQLPLGGLLDKPTGSIRNAGWELRLRQQRQRKVSVVVGRPSELESSASGLRSRWDIDDRPDGREAMPDHLQRWNQVRIAAHEYLLFAQALISVVEHVDGDIDVRALFFRNVEYAVTEPGCRARGVHARDPLSFEASQNRLDERTRLQSVQERLLTHAASTRFYKCREVLDPSNVVVCAETCEVPFEIEPLVTGVFDDSIVEVEAVHVHDGSGLGSAHGKGGHLGRPTG